jgi:fructokinase
MTETGSLVVGEALIDVVRRADGRVERHPGGSGANTALALARLGRPTLLLTRWGDDEDGALLREHLTASGVRLLRPPEDGHPTARAEAVLDRTGSAAYRFSLVWELAPLEVPPDVGLVHTSSIAAVRSPGADRVLELLRGRREAATISYDPNIRPTMMGSRETVRAQVAERVGLCDVVKVSEEDVAWLEPSADPVEVVRDWSARGPALVVLTRGDRGSAAIAGGALVEADVTPATVVDTVGAGDSFMAALLDGLWELDLIGGHRRERLRRVGAGQVSELLRGAGRAAAVTVSRPGADPPVRADLDGRPGTVPAPPT